MAAAALDMPNFDMKAHRARAGKAWTAKMPWDAIYREVHHWVTPYRRPAGNAKAEGRIDHIFDSTAINSAARGAGRLQEDMFPPGRAFFRLTPGPMARAVADAEKAAMGHNGGPPLDDPLDVLTRELDRVSAQIAPFFFSGEWDNAVSEMCLDLFAGTGILLILKGASRERPLRFLCLPIEEVALEPGPYGDVGALFWRTKMSRRAIQAAFPDGHFPETFLKALKDAPDDEVGLNQDIVPDGKGGWHFIVTLVESGDGERPISEARTRTCPFAAPRYYRIPGETYGRGPTLQTLPNIKTLNKAMELTLKAAAIQMLGIWGYRPGGTFNPNAIALKPGAFWPMQSTGGVMGADVSRLDPASGRMEISRELMTELRTQIQAALHDEQLPNAGLTPKSAAEVMARMARVKSNYVGAFGRMIHEVIPVVVTRVIEILYGFDLLVTNVTVDQLFVALEVQSPLAQALRADSHQSTVQAIQLVAALEGPEGVRRRFNLDTLLREMIRDLGVGAAHVRTVKELAEYDQASAQAQASAAASQAMLQKPKDFAEVASMAMGDPEAPDGAAGEAMGGNVVPMRGVA